MARTAADVLESHGFGGERLLKLSRKIANDDIRRRGGESGEEMDEAEAALVERYALSEEARYGLYLIRLGADGYRPRGKGTMIAQRKAREEIRSCSPGR